MAAEITNIPFSWPLQGVTASKTAPKTRLVGNDKAYAIIGTDGNDEGGIRPFQGFRTVRSLDWWEICEDTTGSSTAPDTNHDHTSVVTDFFPIDLSVGPSRYCFGLILRCSRIGGGTADVYLEWRDTVASVWRSLKVMSGVATTGRMEVVVWGRIAYVLVEGQQPQAVYVVLDSDSSPTRMLAKSVAAGPGAQATLTLGTITGTESNGVGVLQMAAGSGAALTTGDYAFAYELRDTRTGRRSGLSQVLQVSSGDFTGSGKVRLGIGVDTAKWDRLHCYRSVKVETGGTYAAAILHLDGIETISTSHPTHDYALKDKPLSLQDIYLSKQVFDEKAPYGGAGCMLDGMLVVGSVGSTPASGTAPQPGDELRNIGELRWSSPSEIGPELFSPLGRYVPENSTSKPLMVRRVGNVAVALCNDRLLHVQKGGSYVQVQELHEGYGLHSDRGACTRGSTLYWYTQRGLHAMGPDGTLEEVRVVDSLLNNEWGDTSDLWMAGDSEKGVVFGLSPSRGKAFVLWLRNAVMTELFDLPFTGVREGAWPRTVDDLSTSLVRRSMWLQNFPSGETPPSGWRPRVCVVDWWRYRTISGSNGSDGMRRVTLLDVDGDCSFTTTGAFSGSDFTAGTIPVETSDRNMPVSAEGSQVYVVWSSDTSFIGRKATLIGTTGSKLTVTSSTKGQLANLPSGSFLSVSPVYVRWESGVIGPTPESDDGQSDSTLQRRRTLHGLTASWTDVDGDVAAHNTWVASAWVGNAQSPVERSVPVNASTGSPQPIATGTSNVMASFGPLSNSGGRAGRTGFALSVGLETMLSDVDYRLLGVKALGTIHRSEKM